jgi:ferredoxin
MAFKIMHERHNCIGCGACTFSPGWEMKDDNKVSFKGMVYKKSKNEGGEIEVGEKDVAEADLDAARVCPVKCILIINTKTGEKIE